MPTLAVTYFNIVCDVLGGFITLFGQVSYLFKEKFYLSEAGMFFLSLYSPIPKLIDEPSDILARRNHLLPSRYEFYQTTRLYNHAGQSRCYDIILSEGADCCYG